MFRSKAAIAGAALLASGGLMLGGIAPASADSPLVTLPTSLEAIDQVAGTLDMTAFEASLSGDAAATAIVGASGGLPLLLAAGAAAGVAGWCIHTGCLGQNVQYVSTYHAAASGVQQLPAGAPSIYFSNLPSPGSGPILQAAATSTFTIGGSLPWGFTKAASGTCIAAGSGQLYSFNFSHTDYYGGSILWQSVVGNGTGDEYFGCAAGDHLVELSVTSPTTLYWRASGNWGATAPKTVDVQGQCRDISNSAVSTVTASQTFSGSWTDVQLPACPQNSILQKVHTYERFLSGQGIPTGGVNLPDNLATNYSTCVSGTTTCTVDAYVNGQSCTSGGMALCQNVGLINGPAYTCQWGPYVMPNSDCAQIVKYYQGVSTTTSGNTNDQSVSAPAAPTQATDCAPSGWEWLNPFTLTGSMGCLLNYEFVPKSAAADVAVQAEAAWATSPAKPFVDAVWGVPTAFAGLFASTAYDCNGPTIQIPSGGFTGGTANMATIHPISTCNDPVKTLAGVVKGFLTVIVVVGGALWVYQPLAVALGWPVVTLWSPGSVKTEDDGRVSAGRWYT